MENCETLLVDLREEVRTALAGMDTEVSYTLRGRYPRSNADGVTVTCGEYSNLSTQCPVVDDVTFEVDVWAFDMDTLRTLCAGVNGALISLGLRRRWSGPDVREADAMGYYRKTFRFGRKVDKRTMRLVD